MSNLAVKLLTNSDLSFFARLVRDSKQKGINLNADVFIDRLYPGLSDSFATVVFPMAIVGPGGKPRHPLTRKVVRTAGAKNWRLNGEVVNDPVDDNTRYAGLIEGDYALFSFEGSDRPRAMTMVLVSATDDALLHQAVAAALPNIQGNRSMAAVDEIQLAAMMRASVSAYVVHPLEQLLQPDSPEEAVFGTAAAQELTTRTNGLGPAINQEAVGRQVASAGESGSRGEELFSWWLIESGQTEETFDWVSLDHARAAYDFVVRTPVWESAELLYVDVKSTKGDFDAPFHMSRAEMRWAATHADYRIARVFSLAEGRAELRILDGIHAAARAILQAAEGLPRGVQVDSFELRPDLFTVIVSGRIGAAS